VLIDTGDVLIDSPWKDAAGGVDVPPPVDSGGEISPARADCPSRSPKMCYTYPIAGVLPPATIRREHARVPHHSTDPSRVFCFESSILTAIKISDWHCSRARVGRFASDSDRTAVGKLIVTIFDTLPTCLS
jgi:hypothetical protein